MQRDAQNSKCQTQVMVIKWPPYAAPILDSHLLHITTGTVAVPGLTHWHWKLTIDNAQCNALKLTAKNMLSNG